MNLLKEALEIFVYMNVGGYSVVVENYLKGNEIKNTDLIPVPFNLGYRACKGDFNLRSRLNSVKSKVVDYIPMHSKEIIQSKPEIII